MGHVAEITVHVGPDSLPRIPGTAGGTDTLPTRGSPKRQCRVDNDLLPTLDRRPERQNHSRTEERYVTGTASTFITHSLIVAPERVVK
jgi:hypothetical protein